MVDGGLKYFNRLVGGEYCMFGRSRAPDHLAGIFRAEQINAITRLTPGLMAGNICNAIVGLLATARSGYWPLSVLWAAAVIGFSVRLLLRHRQHRFRERPHEVSPSAIRRAVINAMALGLLWACLPILFFLDPTPSNQMLSISIAAGMICVAAFSLASIPPAALVFILPLAGTGLTGFFLRGGADPFLVIMLTAALALTLQRAICSYHDQLIKKVVDRATAEEHARKDALTGLLNRKGFEEYINEKAVEPMKRHGKGFTVMYLDLDDFKLINDTFGHVAGDELLRRVAERLSNSVRPEDCVARLGGDEFGIIGCEITDPRLAGVIADRIIRALEAPVYISGKPVLCRTSIGIALAPADGEDAASIIKNADLALYFAKRNKRGDYAFFRSDVDERVQARKKIGQSLRGALEREQFYLEYQPIYSTIGKRIAGFEALLRWAHPEYGRIAPADFIPLAEELGLIQDIGEWVIEAACQALAEWPEDMRISVNFSPLQLKSPTLVQFTLDALERHGIKTSQFEIEVTESVSMEGDAKSLAVLETFQANGISIALDDFGTGFSSLAHVCMLPITRVKIDRSFVDSCLTSPQSLAVIQAITGLARSLKLEVVAEGVETLAQYHMIASHGCEEIQGFLLSAPLSRADATKMANQAEPVLRQVA
jgi:diguanylate cyclase (GGDEF)-like protein